jgi:transcriptional regulator with XRE-family HTH domain
LAWWPIENASRAMVDYAKVLGGRIAEARRRAGFTQEGLAEKARLNVKTIQGIEQGRTDPEIATLRRVARTLAVPVSELVPDDPAFAARKLRRLHEELAQRPPESVAVIASLVHELVIASTRVGKRVRRR